MFKTLIGLVCALLVGCATPGGLSKGDTSEPVSWNVCYDEEGTVVDYDGECESPRAVYWPGTVVRVYIMPDYPDRKAVLQALVVWNSWLGQEVFKVTTHPAQPDVTVLYEPVVNGYAGIARHRLVDGRPQFRVSLAGRHHTNVEILVHEFGHVLGLAHDPGRKRSVMYPGIETYVPWLTRKDCRYLVNLYGLKNHTCQVE